MVIDRLDDSLNSFSEVADLFDENVLGQIPRESSLTSSGQMALLGPEDERHPFLEAYRSLRSSLLFMGEPGKVPKTILVTSSVPNDGKSITSANLAITLALSNSRVLLIDGDLRKGSQHSRFEINHGPGLSEVLSQGIEMDGRRAANEGSPAVPASARRGHAVFERIVSQRRDRRRAQGSHSGLRLCCS
jgi:succinoglycan biosynthesis transport protein ExoP